MGLRGVTSNLLPTTVKASTCIIPHVAGQKVHEVLAVKVLHTSLLNTTVVVFKVLLFGSYTPMPTPSPHFKAILVLVLLIGLQSCRCITPHIINVIKVPYFLYFLYIGEQKKKSLEAYPHNLH